MFFRKLIQSFARACKNGFTGFIKDAPFAHIKTEDYTNENWIRLYKREKYVYDQINKNVKKFNLNNQELSHAFYYFDGKIVIELKKRNIKMPKI